MGILFYKNSFKLIFFFSNLLNFMTRDPIIAVELIGEGAVSKWRDLIGPTDSSMARQEAPTSLRARFGKGNKLCRVCLCMKSSYLG